MTARRRISVISIVPIVLLVFYVGLYAGDKLTLTSGQMSLIDRLQKEQLISIDPLGNSVDIDASLWSKMKYETKEGLSATLAVYCSNRRGSTYYWLDIHDMYSGKKIASYSQSDGLKIY
jgi:hypothetical protein